MKEKIYIQYYCKVLPGNKLNKIFSSADECVLHTGAQSNWNAF